MKPSTHRVNDLLMTIVNDGSTYQTRVKIARMATKPNTFRYASWRWIDLVAYSALKYERQFQPEEKFTTEELLETALCLAAYYREHLAEMEEPSS